MKLLTAILLFAFALAAAAPDLPAGSVATGPGAWRYTDPQGKTWIYRRTPFGLAHFEDLPAPPQVPLDRVMPGARATADGDFVRFERPGPFGVWRWSAPKSALNDVERAVWEASLRQSPTTGPRE